MKGTKYSRMAHAKFVEARPYPFKFFKGCLPHIFLGPFLNTLTHKVKKYYHKYPNYIITIHHRNYQKIGEPKKEKSL